MNIQAIKNKTGFTLLEVMLVVAIIAILAGIVIIAINPAKQLADSRDAQRKADVNQILNAVWQYGLDNDGVMPASITNTPTEICATSTCTGLANLSVLTTDEKYLVAIPKDPQCPDKCTGANGAGYTIEKSANNRITVSAPDKEGTDPISVSR